MTASPIVQVKNGGGSWVSSSGGVDVTPGNTIFLRLANTSEVTQWNLKIFGVDEVTVTAPSLTDVDPETNYVTSPSTEVTFTMPAGVGVGRALVFRSIVNEGGSSLTSTFGVYTLTSSNLRVGAIGERFEGDPTFGWAKTLNSSIRAQDNPVLPALVGDRYAVLMESPVGTLQFSRLRSDQIETGLSINTFEKATPNGDQLYYLRGATVDYITATASYTLGPPDTASVQSTFSGSVGGGDIDPGSWTTTGPSYLSASLDGPVKREGTDGGADPKMIVTLSAGSINPALASWTLTWTGEIWFGVGSAGFTTESQIKSLAGNLVTPVRGHTFTVSPSSQKVYFACPYDYGLPVLTLNGLPVPMTHSEVSVTNIYSVARNFYLLESLNTYTGTGVTLVAT